MRADSRSVKVVKGDLRLCLLSYFEDHRHIGSRTKKSPVMPHSHCVRAYAYVYARSFAYSCVDLAASLRTYTHVHARAALPSTNNNIITIYLTTSAGNCNYVRRRSDVRIHTRTCTYVYVRVRIRTYTYVYAHVRARAYTHVHVRIRTCTYAV